MTEKTYQIEIRSIDAWREPCPDACWTWNASYMLENDIFIVGEITARRILNLLRKWGYLSKASKGKLSVQDAGDLIEIRLKSTQEPILAVFVNGI